jgi:hypothetical protein
MAITRARTSSVAQGPSTRKTVLGGNDVILGGSYDAIGFVDVGSGGQSTVTFSSIPGTYKHLQLRLYARGAYVGGNFNNNILIRFNSDSGSNYSRHLLYAQNNSTALAFGASNTTSAFAGASPNASTGIASVFAGGVTDILDYANTNKFKTVRTLQGYDTNGGGNQRVSFESSAWRNSASAITSITITSDNADNWVQHSSFALYGIK